MGKTKSLDTSCRQADAPETVVYDSRTIQCACSRCLTHLVARVRAIDGRVEFWTRHAGPERMQPAGHCPGCGTRFPTDWTRERLLEELAGKPAC